MRYCSYLPLSVLSYYSPNAGRYAGKPYLQYKESSVQTQVGSGYFNIFVSPQKAIDKISNYKRSLNALLNQSIAQRVFP